MTATPPDGSTVPDVDDVRRIAAISSPVIRNPPFTPKQVRSFAAGIVPDGDL